MKLCFIAGMPRSGSTLFSNLLMQNPRFYATGTSGLVDVLRTVRDVTDKNPAFKSMPREQLIERKRGLLSGIVNGYFDGIDADVVFDKSRGWPTLLEMMSWLIGRDNVRVIMCVRDLRDVLASFEKLYRKTSEYSSTTQEKADHLAHRTAIGRAEFIMRAGEPVGYAMDVMQDCVTRGWADRLFFVEYDKFCEDTQEIMDAVYDFIGEKSFEHNPDFVEQKTSEDDSVHGFVGLHDIRNKIEPQVAQWPVVYDKAVLATDFWARVTMASRFWER